MKAAVNFILIFSSLLSPAMAIGAEESGMSKHPAYSHTSEKKMAMKIRVKVTGNTTVFELNNSKAAKDLYAQLPLSIAVKDYSDNEKIFYPPNKLNTSDTPPAEGGRAGTLAYYAPWGDVVIFFKGFSPAPGLYELGQVTSGSEHMAEMSGTIQIEKDSTP